MFYIHNMFVKELLTAQCPGLCSAGKGNWDSFMWRICFSILSCLFHLHMYFLKQKLRRNYEKTKFQYYLPEVDSHLITSYLGKFGNFFSSV